jgi:hypothetical protein
MKANEFAAPHRTLLEHMLVGQDIPFFYEAARLITTLNKVPLTNLVQLAYLQSFYKNQ